MPGCGPDDVVARELDVDERADGCGVAPVGHPEPIGTLVDVELARYDQVWAAAGHPAAVFPTTYAELLGLTAGTAAEVGPGPAEQAMTTAGAPAEGNPGR